MVGEKRRKGTYREDGLCYSSSFGCWLWAINPIGKYR
jgi:hypothetical protein